MRRGFTLTELLVTIGIIVALTGVGIPIFKGMKETANEAACVSRLRGLGVAMESYLLDHGDFFPRMQMGRKAGSGRNNVLEEVLRPYVDGPEAFQCPSDHEDYAATGSSYFWNHHASGLKKSRVVMMGMASGSSKIPLIHDKEAYHGDEDGTNFLFLDMSAGKDLDFDVESE